MLNALADQCLDAASYERAVLAHFGGAVGFDVAFFATVPGGPPTTIGLDPAVLDEAFTTHRYDQELLPLKQAAFAAHGVAVDTDVLGPGRVRRCAYYRDLAAPVGGRHSLLAYLSLRGRPLGVLMLGRTGSTFTERDVDAVASSLPAITLGRASFHAPLACEPLPSLSAARRVAAWTGVAHARRGALTVRDRGGYREMLAGDFVWTRASLVEPRRSGWFYVDLFHLAAARARSRARALFIGCGGAVAVRQFAETYPGIALDVVDIDPDVVTLANDWYGLSRIPSVTVHVADGADFVARAGSHAWDVIVVDAFGPSLDPPPALATRAFFRDLRRVLRPGGAVALNTIGPLRPPSPVRTMERAMRGALTDVRLVPVLDANEDFSPSATRNVVLLGGT